MASIRSRTNAAGFTRWAVLWRDPDTRTQQSVTMDYEADAIKLKLLLDANGQSFAASEQVLTKVAKTGPTMDEVFEMYAADLTRPNEGTIKKYRANYRVHLRPMFGSLQVESIDHGHIVSWVKSMQAQNKSAKTIHGVHAILSAVMKTAIRKKIRLDSPCDFIVLPKDNQAGERTTSLSRAEYELILKYTPAPYKLFVEFLAGTGLRFGEATALTFSDFSLSTTPATVRVEKAWKTNEHGAMYLGAPKSKRSRRTVSLDKVLAKKILELGGKPAERVFLSEKGGQVRSGGFHNLAWKPALAGARADVDSPLTQTPRPHDLRHTHASWLVQAGVNIFTVSRRLGHESITTTMDRYSHLMPDALADAAEAINRVMR
jgi:integrase